MAVNGQTAPKDVGGVKPDRVMVSDGSRGMARNAPDLTLQEVRAEKAQVVARIQKLDDELAKLNDRVRGKALPPAEYQRICELQAELKGMKREEQAGISRLNNMLKELSPDRHAQTAAGVERLEAAMERVERALAEVLRRLRKDQSA